MLRGLLRVVKESTKEEVRKVFLSLTEGKRGSGVELSDDPIPLKGIDT